MRHFIPVLLAACATTATPPPAGGPRGLRASEHLEHAREHERQAREPTWPSSPPSAVDPNAPNLWFATWNPSAEHERAASAHRSKAAALQAAYDDACANRSLADIAVSPLQRYATGGWNTTTGVVLYLAPSISAERLLEDLACHRAWMMLAPSNMDDCPLDLPGLALDARGDAEGITVTIVVRNTALVGELQRRAAVELESAARHRASDAR